ncbi:MAG: hypothetical protein MPK75_07905 [Alphaproteobacteria bacterium]|nr:hypothetical protein [Alphaproteobacteria bacterium]
MKPVDPRRLRRHPAPHLSVSIVKNQDGRGRASCERSALARASRRRGLKSARRVRRKRRTL